VNVNYLIPVKCHCNWLIIMNIHQQINTSIYVDAWNLFLLRITTHIKQKAKKLDGVTTNYPEGIVIVY